MPKGIIVTGTGEVRAAPDIAVLTLGVENTARSVSEARALDAEAANTLISALLAAGMTRADIQTTQLSLTPQYDHRPEGPPVVAGYTASNTLRITIRDLSLAGAVVDAALEAAGDAGRLQGIQYSFANPEPLYAEARVKAGEDARRKAEALARGAGVKLGAVVSIVESVPAGRPEPRFREMAMMAAGTPVEPGQSAVSAAVTIQYAIKR